MNMKDICYHIPKISSSDDEMRRILDSGSSLDEFDINFTLMGCSGISFKDLQNMVKRNQVEIGDYILTPYNRDSTPLIAWKVIDKNGNKVILNTIDVIDFMPFSENGLNKYKKSDIKKWLINELPKKLPLSFVSMVNRYSSQDELVNGDKFWLLELDELKKCYPSKEDSIKYSLVNYRQFQSGKAAPWWLRSPDSGCSDVEYCVHDSGDISFDYASRIFGCSPACIFG